jgi:predicted Na+-dependent transporter
LRAATCLRPIFNASISSLLGIVLTPLLAAAFLPASASPTELGGLATQLLWQVVLPVGAGILLNARFGPWAQRHSPGLRLFDQLTILLIVFTAFCDSFAEGIFYELPAGARALAGRGHGGAVRSGIRAGVGAEPGARLLARRPGGGRILRL